MWCCSRLSAVVSCFSFLFLFLIPRLLLLLLPSAPLLYLSALDSVLARGCKRRTCLVPPLSALFFWSSPPLNPCCCVFCLFFCLVVLFLSCCFSLCGVPSTVLSCGRPLDNVVLQDSCLLGLHFLREFFDLAALLAFDYFTHGMVAQQSFALAVTLCGLLPSVFHVLLWQPESEYCMSRFLLFLLNSWRLWDRLPYSSHDLFHFAFWWRGCLTLIDVELVLIWKVTDTIASEYNNKSPSLSTTLSPAD